MWTVAWLLRGESKWKKLLDDVRDPDAKQTVMLTTL
jgi:hypothetical protein